MAALEAQYLVLEYTDNQNAVRIIPFRSMVKELEIFFSFRSQIQLDMIWIPRDQNSQADFFSKIVDFDDYSVIDEVFIHLEELWARILLTDLLAVTTLNCPGLIPDSFSQILRLLMISHEIGLHIITGLYYRQLSSAECYVTCVIVRR